MEKKWKTKRKVPRMEQMTQNECGISCLNMLLSYYNYEIDMASLRQYFGDGRDGISLLKIKEVARIFELDGAGKRVSIQQILQEKFPFPAIAYFENKHFVILEKVKKGYFYIVDPVLGEVKLNINEFEEKYSGVILFLWPNRQFKTKKKKVNLDFPKKILKFKQLIFSIFTISLILQGLAIGVPIAIKSVIDKVLIEGQSDLFSIFMFGFIGIVIFQVSFSAIKNYSMIQLQNKLDQNLMNEFLSHLLKLPYKFFETRSRGDLIYRANSNIQIREFLSQQLISSVINIFLVIVIFTYMMIESKLLALSILSIGVMQISTILLSRPRLKYLTKRQVSNQALTSSFMTESLGGMSTIKALGIEDDIYKKWNRIFGKQIESTKNQEVFKMKVDIITDTLSFVTPLVVICIGGIQMMKGEMTLGSLFAFQTLAMSFLSPLNSLANLISDIVSIETLLDRIYDVLKTKPEQSNGSHEMRRLNDSIELKNVSFRYNEYGEEVIKNVSLKIEVGQKLAIVGKSGSGKSTLASLIVGLYTPTKGKILFDGHNYTEIEKKSFRRQVGVVLQENFLFNKTVYENIVVHNPEVNINDVIYAAKLAEIHDEITSIPMGYETIVSETGANFSGGQKQRIALARALVGKPSIILLDEATSALDSVTEQKIENNLQNINSTRIVIAHRLSTIQNADIIIVMDQGKVVAKGTHEELMLNSNYYRDLYKSRVFEKKVATISE